MKSYWVETINEDHAFGHGGFVYEAGAFSYAGFLGNRIHLHGCALTQLSRIRLVLLAMCLGDYIPCNGYRNGSKLELSLS